LNPIPVRLRKILFLPLGEEKLVVRYTIQNKGRSRLQTRFASEWNFNLLGGGGNDQAYYRIQGQLPGRPQESPPPYTPSVADSSMAGAGTCSINRHSTAPALEAHFDSMGEVLQVHELHIGNSWLRQDVGFSLSEAATLWRFSIDTVTGSEAGFERNHQGSCLTLLWPLLLEAGERWSVEITSETPYG
jgi:4-alpha-glucanotransferase